MDSASVQPAAMHIAAVHRRSAGVRAWPARVGSFALVRLGRRGDGDERHAAPGAQAALPDQRGQLEPARRHRLRRPGACRESARRLFDPVFELGGTCDSIAFAQYNLVDRRYAVDGHPVGAGVDFHWLVEAAGNPRMKADFYTSDNLRAVSER